MKPVIRATIAISYEHAIHFTHDVFGAGNPLLKDLLISKKSRLVPRVIIVMDENLATAQPGLAPSINDYFAKHQTEIALACPPLLIHGGEVAKNTPAFVDRIYSLLNQHSLCRHSYVIAIGGGALLDVVGFAAATAHRGMRHIRIPTTVLSQDDAGVGIKNGINAFGKKNFIGTFAPPFAVINDFAMLASLPDREKRAGFIEAIKVALIRDQSFFEWIERHLAGLQQFEPAVVEDLIHRCAKAHVRHIATGGDPFEMGSARPLDFGHWSAHKLEQLSEFKIHHGEAVAIGIGLDVIYSSLVKHLNPETAERILNLIEALGFELYAPELIKKDTAGNLTVLKGLDEFREHLGGTLAITLLKDIGRGFEVDRMDKELIVEAIQRLSRRGTRKTLKS
jgi:3-dehydroquinate synthase